MSKTMCIDFDGTISEYEGREPGPPKPGVRKALRKFKKQGYIICVYTCRTNLVLRETPIACMDEVRMIEKYMNRHSIPFDLVLNNQKPIADIYIDNRAIGYRDNWDKVVKEVENGW